MNETFGLFQQYSFKTVDTERNSNNAHYSLLIASQGARSDRYDRRCMLVYDRHLELTAEWNTACNRIFKNRNSSQLYSAGDASETTFDAWRISWKIHQDLFARSCWKYPKERFLLRNSVVQTKLNRYTMMCNMECSSNPYVDPVVIPIELDERSFNSEFPEMLGLLYL